MRQFTVALLPRQLPRPFNCRQQVESFNDTRYRCFIPTLRSETDEPAHVPALRHLNTIDRNDGVSFESSNLRYCSSAFAVAAEEDSDSDADEDGGRDQDFGDGEELVGLVFSGDDGEHDGERCTKQSDGGEGDGDGAASGDAYDIGFRG